MPHSTRNAVVVCTLLLTALGPPAEARGPGFGGPPPTLVRYAFVCDAEFDAIARNNGYAACSDMIRQEFVNVGIQFVNQNTNAGSNDYTYYLSGSWKSPSVGSSTEAFLTSLDAYSNFEEQRRWNFKLGFTGKRMQDRAGVAKTTWRGGGPARNAAISYYEADGQVNVNWATTALHELTHLLRDDGYHHNNDQSSNARWCAMDVQDYALQQHVGEICAYCRGQINRMTYGWTSLTQGGGPATLGSGYRVQTSTPGQTWRWAEQYWGLLNIDDIRWENDSTGTPHHYVVGDHTLDAAEYRMELGYSGNDNDLGLTGKADRPGPVILNVFNDGHYDRTYYWGWDNNANQTSWRQIHNWPAAGTRHIGVQLIPDVFNGLGDGDLDLFLDALGVW